MKRVINRRVYDTESAEQIAQTIHEVSCRETLYKRADEEYFIHREEWLNRYLIKYDEMDPSRELVIPLSDDEAIEWCEQNEIDAELIISEFEELIER